MDVKEARQNNTYCPVCEIRLNMPPRYCCVVCEDSAMAAFERDRERWSMIPR